MKIHLIAAARPNFMKIAPLYHSLERQKWAEPFIVHTGQHYDLNMSDVFFENFGLPEPHINLGVGSGTHAEQTGNVMIAYEKVLTDETPDLVVVVGDVNSTAAAAMAAVKLGVKMAHLEAGLRSFDRAMPEEINRVVTDAVADFLWTPSPDGNDNLENEGVDPGKVTFVGNIMIDSLVMAKEEIEKQKAYSRFGCRPGQYGLVTLHRPSNVDDPEVLKRLCKSLAAISENVPLIFPVHPRTVAKLEQFNIDLLEKAENIHLTKPLGYNEFMNLVFNCRLVITDSGGIQEETTYLQIPCLTLRPNTERPATISKAPTDCAPPTILPKRLKPLLTADLQKEAFRPCGTETQRPGS
ncbi:MAG: UDP-N-acetylglucosamine 2-epimerase (non-hydrolyzing) [Thermodesulfobacteriota bacterium]|nr:UDP-N-acetylglucosamine 2-epimerase (non-hydrolyzing) [Thermodesulfobacteriota bacterium]